MDAKRWPIDFESLKKGDVITADELERIFKATPGSKTYLFRMMSLKEKIEVERRKLHDPIVVKECNNELHLLTDEQAVDYTDRECEMAKRRYGRNLKRMMSVDRSKLRGETDKRHLRNIEVRSRGYQAMQLAERGKLVLEPHKRKTPVRELTG